MRHLGSSSPSGRVSFRERSNVESDILAGAEEFSFDGGPVGALLIHGFTEAPRD